MVTTEDFDPPYPEDDAEAPPDAETANAYLRAWQRCERELDEYNRLYSLEQQRLQKRWEELVAPVRARQQRLYQSLSAYHEGVLARSPATKTIHLPAGDLKSREAIDRIEVTNPDDLLVWAEANLPEAIEPSRPRLNRAWRDVIKARASRTSDGIIHIDGEVVPGITFMAGEDRPRSHWIETPESHSDF